MRSWGSLPDSLCKDYRALDGRQLSCEGAASQARGCVLLLWTHGVPKEGGGSLDRLCRSSLPRELGSGLSTLERFGHRRETGRQTDFSEGTDVRGLGVFSLKTTQGQTVQYSKSC